MGFLFYWPISDTEIINLWFWLKHWKVIKNVIAVSYVLSVSLQSSLPISGDRLLFILSCPFSHDQFWKEGIATREFSHKFESQSAKEDKYENSRMVIIDLVITLQLWRDCIGQGQGLQGAVDGCRGMFLVMWEGAIKDIYRGGMDSPVDLQQSKWIASFIVWTSQVSRGEGMRKYLSTSPTFTDNVLRPPPASWSCQLRCLFAVGVLYKTRGGDC